MNSEFILSNVKLKVLGLRLGQSKLVLIQRGLIICLGELEMKGLRSSAGAKQNNKQGERQWVVSLSSVLRVRARNRSERGNLWGDLEGENISLTPPLKL